MPCQSWPCTQPHGSAPQLHHLDTTAALSNLMPEDAFPTAAQAMYTTMECAISTVVDQAAQALDSATDMLDSLPSALLQEVLSSTLDLMTPVRKLVKRPSQLQNAGAVPEQEMGGVDMDALE
ncbi:hypothetical protein WJX77_006951 [Trebouxia sp. C0004]